MDFLFRLETAGGVRLYFPRARYASAAPLGGSSRTHEYHVGNAVSHSREIHVRHGTGGQGQPPSQRQHDGEKARASAVAAMECGISDSVDR